MNVLAIDTSTWSLALGLMAEDRLLGEYNTTLAKNHSLRLMPAISELFNHVDMTPKELDGIAVAHGPGSYTGVRIGLTTAKSMAWSLGIPIASLSSLQVVAQNAYGFQGKIIPLFDARRGQAYIGVYETSPSEQIVKPVEADRLEPITKFLAHLDNMDGPFLFLGEGVQVHEPVIVEMLGERAQIAPSIYHAPRGGQLAYLAVKTWNEHVRDVHGLAPRYLQLAEAEKKWLSKQESKSGESGES